MPSQNKNGRHYIYNKGKLLMRNSDNIKTNPFSNPVSQFIGVREITSLKMVLFELRILTHSC